MQGNFSDENGNSAGSFSTRATKEKKLADTLMKSLDTLDFDFIHSAWMLTSRAGSALQRNLFELVLAYLNQWAFMYDQGGIEKRDPMYSVCQMSSKMIKSLGS